MSTYSVSPATPTPIPSQPAPLTGTHLTCLLKDANTRQRAEIAAQLVTGELRPVWLSPAQAARLVRSVPWMVHEALKSPTVVPLPVHAINPLAIDGGAP